MKGIPRYSSRENAETRISIATTVAAVHSYAEPLIFHTASTAISGAFTTMLIALGRNCWTW